MSELLSTMLGGEPEFGPVCERLVAWAIEQGGADNICVALAAVPAAAAEGEDAS